MSKRTKRREDKKLVRKFVRDYLRQDGVLVVRLINANVNSIIVAEFVGELWEHFITNPRMGNKHGRTHPHSDSEIDDV